MATSVDTAVTSSVAPKSKAVQRATTSTVSNDGSMHTSVASRIKEQKKYRHVAAVHHKARTSCLSHDSEATPSFVGARNLMAMVLGIFPGLNTVLVRSTCN